MPDNQKTLKREVGIAGAIWLLAIATAAFFMATSDADRFAIIESFKYPLLGILFAALGMDWVSKQTDMLGPKTGQNQQPPANQ